MNDSPNPDASEIQPMQLMPPGAMEAQTRAEFDIAVVTAHRFPRSIDKARKLAQSLATIDEDVAGSCFYKLTRGRGEDSKPIEGPSVRFAEIVANSYGNMKFGARIIDIGQKEVVAQGIAHDLENNVSVSVDTRRRITDRKGKRYSDDMIAVTCNAACSIALRNAIFKAVPFALFKPIYEMAKLTAIGDAKTLTERRSKMLAAFGQMGIGKERILSSLNLQGIDDINLTHMETLLGQYNAIKDGDTSADEQFPDPKLRRSAEDNARVVASATGEVHHNIDDMKKATDLMAELADYGDSWKAKAREIKRQNGTDWAKMIKDTELALVHAVEVAADAEPVVVPDADGAVG